MLVCWAVAWWLVSAGGWCAAAVQESGRVSARVGGHALMDCHLDFPFGHHIPYHLLWDKDGEMVLSWMSGDAGSAVGARWAGRVRRVQQDEQPALQLGGVQQDEQPALQLGGVQQDEQPALQLGGVQQDEQPALQLGGVQQDEQPALQLGGVQQDEQPALQLGGVQQDEQPALQLGGGAINVSAVRETDAGLYRCRVSFPNRSPPARNNGTFYYLHVEGGNQIVTPPVNLTVLEGQRAELECAPKSLDSEVLWFKDGAPLETLPELAARVDRPLNGSLVLRAAASSDIGEYACRVHAPDGSSQSASAFLDVQYKAKVVYAPGERYLPYGKPASLDCHFDANPPLTNLRWEKDGFLFDPYNVPGVFYSRNGSLLFNEVDESHEGEYSCTPYNALGSAGPSPRVRVLVSRPPVLLARPPPLVLARPGAAVALPCVPATAAPPQPAPSVTWMRKDGGELPAGRHSLDGGNLTIADVAEEDGGVYVCTVSNAAAAVNTETELVVENTAPRAPHDLVARATASQLQLSWQPGRPGALAHYTVWYRERSHTDWKTFKVLPKGVTEATLAELRPDTEYELRVLAQDHIGDGLFSRPVYVRTLEPEEVDGEMAFAATTTETSETGETSATSESSGRELEVTVRVLEDGALVRWSRDSSDRSRCSLRWYAGATDEPVTVLHTHLDYALVRPVGEDEQYRAVVRCASGAGGVGALRVPGYSRLRAVALGAAGAALVLAALSAGALLLRRRRARAAPPAAPAPAFPHLDKRRP